MAQHITLQTTKKVRDHLAQVAKDRGVALGLVEQFAAQELTAEQRDARLLAYRENVRGTIGVEIGDEEFDQASYVPGNAYRTVAEKVRVARGGGADGEGAWCEARGTHPVRSPPMTGRLWSYAATRAGDDRGQEPGQRERRGRGMSAQPVHQDGPSMPMPLLARDALREAVKRVSLVDLPQFDLEAGRAFDQASQTGSTAPLRLFLRRWGVFVAIERDPARAARLHEAERISQDDAVGEAAFRAAMAEINGILREAERDIEA